MAKTVKKIKKTVEEEKKFESRSDIQKLSLYVSIVNAGISNNVIKLLESIGCSASFVQKGEGTATQDLLNILNISDTKKDVVMSIVKNVDLEEVQKQMNAFFAAAKRNRGIGFAIPMKSIVGVKAYKFLSQTM